MLQNGDATTDNVMLSHGRLSAFVDLSLCEVGDPRCDIATILDKEPPLSPLELAAFVHSYGLPLPSEAEIAYCKDLYLFF